MNKYTMPDPVQPTVTFDSYVIPGSVQAHAGPKGDRHLNGTIIAVSVIAVLTFLLGVMETLQFMGPRQVIVTAQVPEPVLMPDQQDVTEDTVTRAQGTDLLAPAMPVVAMPGPAMPGPAMPVVEMPVVAKPEPALEQAVLQGLQPKRTVGTLTEQEQVEKAREALSIISRNKMRMLREGVLAGVYTVKAKQDGDTKRLVLETVNAEMTRESTGNLLLEAAERGDIDIPASLNTADGEIDLDTLLFNLIQTSLATDGTPEGEEAAREMSRRAFAASSAKTIDVKGARVYVVEAGDSLAYISLQFYGRPYEYERIFQANRDVLSSPDLIRTGQRLIIPG
ncbi:MAG: LysM peptidoglycan-binding domain-containing protein [Sulfitobacter sp.]|nr:LysM peptidoglycan-binding domain-containing protein [Sulfitobacter sp.]